MVLDGYYQRILDQPCPYLPNNVYTAITVHFLKYFLIDRDSWVSSWHDSTLGWTGHPHVSMREDGGEHIAGLFHEHKIGLIY